VDTHAKESRSLDAKLLAIPPLVLATASRLKEELSHEAALKEELSHEAAAAALAEATAAERAAWQKRASAVESKVSARNAKNMVSGLPGCT
jgi:hypothetical protein